MLARGLVDEFRYNEKGNEVTLVKKFPQQTVQASDAAIVQGGTEVRRDPQAK